MAFTPFPPRQPSSSARLPLTLMTLDDWALATISGPDSEKYLQGQITADVSHLTDAQHLLAAHCDAKGKMWSNLRVFRREGGFAWIERRSLRDAQLTELKKYAVFSKVTIAANDDLVLLGVAGFQARAALAPLFAALPDAATPVVSEGATSLLWFEHPGERFLLVTDVDTANRVTDALRGEAQFNNSQQWLALNIEAGLPVIDSANSGQFIPQATNLQALGGISFKKGCYTGQEVVSRIEHIGKTNRRTVLLAANDPLELAPGTDLTDNQGQVVATVLYGAKLADRTLLLAEVSTETAQSEVALDTTAATLHRLPLPYGWTRTK